MNIVAFIIYGVDKYKAQHAKWRITEATLLWIAGLGGALGSLLGIFVWHHKTLHPQFRYGVPAILVVHMLLLVWWHLTGVF